MRVLMYLFLLLAVIGIVFGKAIDGTKAARNVRQDDGGVFNTLLGPLGDALEETLGQIGDAVRRK